MIVGERRFTKRPQEWAIVPVKEMGIDAGSPRSHCGFCFQLIKLSDPPKTPPSTVPARLSTECFGRVTARYYLRSRRGTSAAGITHLAGQIVPLEAPEAG